MRDRWYSDNRDVVKWGALLHLSETSKCDAILQVAFYRPEVNQPRLHEDGRPVAFPNAVLAHFRDMEQIKSLAGESHIQIEIFKEPFNGSRQNYTAKLTAVMEHLCDKRLIVFLDPDTGLAPSSRLKPQHVQSEELAQVYGQLKPGDWLVLYQHRQRRRDWLEHSRGRFTQVLDLPPQKVKTFYSFELASDVVLFAAQRPVRGA